MPSLVDSGETISIVSIVIIAPEFVRFDLLHLASFPRIETGLAAR